IEYRSIQINNQNYVIVESELLEGSSLLLRNLNDGSIQAIAPGAFPSINNKNQVAFVRRRQDLALVVSTPQQAGGFNEAVLDIDPSSSADLPRPVIADDGSVLVRAG